MCVVGSRGQNLYDAKDANGETRTFELPKRLRHVVFIRPGCFVFTRIDPTRRDGVVKGDIEVFVLDSFLPVLRKAHYWPSVFAERPPPADKVQANEVAVAADAAPVQAVAVQPAATDETRKESSSEEEDLDDELFGMGGNPNRASWAYSEESSDEEETSRINN